MITAYEHWLSLPPYGWTQAEKERRYIPYLQELTAYHRNRCAAYDRALQVQHYTKADTLAQLPFLPVSLFKKFDLKSIKETEIFKTVTSSGTSGQAVSRIPLNAANARAQQTVLSRIGQHFLGSQRLPMLIIDTPAVFADRNTFNARGTAILGFSLFAKKKYFALQEDLSLNRDILKHFADHPSQPFFIFGFTAMIWKYFYEAVKNASYTVDFSHAVLIHGGGWKKMLSQSVTAAAYKQELTRIFGITRIHNYYGMAEQTGCIYMECEYGHLHASIFSDILIRDPLDFSLCPVGKEGIVQVLTPLATAYVGHSILTEDLGVLLGTDDCPCGRKGNYFHIHGRIPQAELRGCSDVPH